MITIYSYGQAVGPAPEGVKPSDMHDCRGLYNPYRIRLFRNLDGQDQQVMNFLRQSDGYAEFIAPFKASLKDGNTYAFYCMGGMHRSVVVAEDLASACVEKGLPFFLHHMRLRKSKRG